MATLHITIPGEPIGKPRMTQRDKWAKRPCVQRYWAWCDAARYHANMAGELPRAEQTMHVEILAYSAPPKSLSKKKAELLIGGWKRTKPDGDNISKGVCDALWKDDEKLGDIFVRRRWDWTPRLEISIVYTPSPQAAEMAVAA